MTCDGGHEATFIAGPTTRRFDSRTWSAERRIEHMDRYGIAVQALSPLPELLAYWFEPRQTALLCRHVNDAMARMVQAHPSRFVALGGLPMNDADLAVAEARRLREIGFAGIELGSNINGLSLAEPRFSDVLNALHELDLSVFVHGLRPEVTGRLVGPPVLGAVVGVPMDTALCVTSFIGARVLERLPRLRVGFSHAGGGFGSVLDRLRHVWTLMPELREQMPDPVAEARRFFYDALTFGADYARHVIDRVGADQVFVGTDFPGGGMALMDPMAFLRELKLCAQDEVKVSRETAQRFLNVAF
jgi:aminocarboxymuconate-semialdehyde decarboxylase